MIQSIELLKSCCRTKKRSSSKTKCYVFLVPDEIPFCNIKKKSRTKFNSLENNSFNILEWTNTFSNLSSTSFLVYFSRVKAKVATWVCQWTVLNQGNPSSSLGRRVFKAVERVRRLSLRNRSTSIVLSWSLPDSYLSRCYDRVVTVRLLSNFLPN